MAKKFARRRATKAERQQAYKDFQAVLEEKEPKDGRKFRKRRADGERFSGRQYQKFLDAGGEEGTGGTFKEWLKANWKTIFAQLLSLLMSLLTKGAV